jgi:hypothetical protein
MKNILNLFILSVLLLSCSENSNNTISPTKFKISASTETVEVFPWSLISFEMTIESGEFSTDEQPVFQDTTIGSFEIRGPWFKDNAQQKLFFQISGKEMPASAKTVIMNVQIGNQKCQVPITVKVSEFYLAQKFDTNLQNDTINIPKGGNYLLKITCKDSSGQTTSRKQIERLGFGLHYAVNQNQSNQKFIVSSADRDTINYYIMFSAFPDIAPSSDDSNLWFTFYLSNKNITWPIKIIY